MFLFAALTAINMTASAQETFMKGGQFMDYILPINGSEAATADDWGTTAGSYVKNGETLTWPGTLGRWKDNGIEDTEHSYWGGNAQKGDDGKYHIFVAGWPEKSPNGHDTWKTGSRCYHGVSDKPDQGFVFKEELGAGHNTESYRLADGRTVVYNIELRYISNETRLDENTTWTLGKFQWDKRDRRLSRGVDPTVSLSNCTFARRPDNSYLMMDRGGCVWVSSDGVDEYHQQTDHTAYAGNRTRYFEDPVIWYDGMQYFMVVNDYDARQAYLSRSLDGLHWVNEPGVAYKTGVVKHQNGDLEDWYKLERPKIQTDEQGRATYIHFAVVDAEKDADKGSDTHSSKNIIAPLVKSRFLEVVGNDVITASTTSIRVKIKKEEDFNPANINLSSLRFGSYDVVNYGNGFTATASETDDDGNLIVTFTGAAGASGITADEFAPKMIGEDNSGNIVYGYAKLPYVNYKPAMVSALIPGINADNYITTVHVDNYGLSTSEEMTVKVMTTTGTVLSTGTVHAIAPYASEDVTLTGSVKPSAGIEQIVIAFYKDGTEVDRNTLYTDDINAGQAELARLVNKAKGFIDDEKYTTGKDALTTIYNEGQQKLAWFDAAQLTDLNSRLTQAMKTFLYANGITTQSWDFYTAALADGSITMTNSNATTLNGHSMKIADYMTVSGTQQKFYGRIAMDQGSGWLNLRNSGEGMNNTGLFNYNNDSYLSVLNLQPGDEITFSLPDDKHNPKISSENVYVKGDANKTILAAGTEITSGTTYVVKEGSQMDILTYHYTCITGLNVESSTPETVTTPEITNDAAFLVTITPGESSAGMTVSGTYYTTDGTTPTQQSTLYTAPFTVSKNALVKAVTYLPNGTASAVKAIRATVPDQTWDFTDNTTWTDTKLTQNKQYDPAGVEVQAGGVLLNFESEKATFKYGSTASLWWLVSGSGTQPEGNYIQVVVPNDTKMTVNTTGWSTERCFWYTVNGTTGSSGTKFATSTGDRAHEFTNTSGASQTYTIWVNNQFNGNNQAQIHLSSIVLKDISEVFEHTTTISAKCGDTQIAQWTMENVQEFSDYTISGKAYIKKDGQLYVMNDPKFTATASRDYSYTTQMELEDQAVTINYDRYDRGDIVYFSEAETLNNVGTNASTTASGGMTAHVNGSKMATLCTLPAGHYSIYVGMTQDRDVYLRNAGVSDNTQNTILYWNKNQSDVKTFDLNAETQLALSGYTTGNGGLNQGGDVDFILIRTTGVDVPAATLGYQTFAADCALDFSAATTKAYIATNVDNDRVYLQQVTKVPAGTGLLLEGTEAETIPVLTINDAEDVTNNLLVRGNDTEVSKEDGYNKYVLAADDGNNTSVSFYLINNTATTVSKGKSYLKVSSGSNPARRITFSFGDDITGIKSVSGSTPTTDDYYNMAGQRVANPTHGLYIKNRKKIYIK